MYISHRYVITDLEMVKPPAVLRFNFQLGREGEDEIESRNLYGLLPSFTTYLRCTDFKACLFFIGFPNQISPLSQPKRGGGGDVGKHPSTSLQLASGVYMGTHIRSILVIKGIVMPIVHKLAMLVIL